MIEVETKLNQNKMAKFHYSEVLSCQILKYSDIMALLLDTQYSNVVSNFHQLHTAEYSRTFKTQLNKFSK